MDSPLEPQSPVAMETTKGFAVKINNSNVIQFGPKMNVNKDISMSDFRINYLPATKYYVDKRKPLITVWAEATGGIDGEEYQWSFGSGSGSRGHRRSGYTMMVLGRILRMKMSASSVGNPVSGIARTNIVINGREQGQYHVVILGGQYSGTTVFGRGSKKPSCVITKVIQSPASDEYVKKMEQVS